jgi:hypothetical protein
LSTDKDCNVIEDQTKYCEVDDVIGFMEQISIALLSIVNGINATVAEMNTTEESDSNDNDD